MGRYSRLLVVILTATVCLVQPFLSTAWVPPMRQISSTCTASSTSYSSISSLSRNDGTATTVPKWRRSTMLRAHPNDDSTKKGTRSQNPVLQNLDKASKSAMFALALTVGSWTSSNIISSSVPPAVAADGAAIGLCLLQKCQLSLAKCIANPFCLANVICINSCNGKADETGCQIECGNLFENDVVGEFNKCAVSDMDCVPKKADDGSYPVPSKDKLVQKFDTSLFDGRWYISAGQNKLFDTFPCQVHFFTNTEPGKFYGKLNWRIEEPDGEFFTRDALQRFIQDPKQPGHLINHDNEYLHYEDDWYILDYEYDNNPTGTPPFAFVYYRGSNDAWEGYGGLVVYTRAKKLPDSLLPRVREAANKVGFDFDKDFAVTDNTCPPALDNDKALLLREKFAGKVALQTEQQLQAQATRLRGNVVNGVKAQVLFVNEELEQASKAFDNLAEQAAEFENSLVQGAEKSK